MRRFGSQLFFVAVTLLAGFPLGALAQTTAAAPNTEKIERYWTTVTVQTDASIRVEETIIYNFGSNQKHGIFRNVPVVYATKSGTNERLELENITVTDENRKPYAFTTSTMGNDRQIKIGDPSILVTGEHTYDIRYTVPNAIGFFDTYDEIYWNAMGNEWPVPIDIASVLVEFPFAVPNTGTFGIACYVGPQGSNTPCDRKELAVDTKGYRAIDFSHEQLAPGEGLTVAVGFPKGLVVAPPRPWWESFLPYVYDALLLLPILALVFQLRRWRKSGRDPKGTGIITAQYEAPDDLSPMQIKFIKSESFGDSLSAEIIYLATLGYLKITRIEKKVLFITNDDFELTKLKEADDLLTAYQNILFTNLFSKNTVTLSDLKNVFYKTARKVEGECETSVAAAGYFPPRRRKITVNGVLSSTYTTSESKIFALFIIIFGTIAAIVLAAYSLSLLTGFAIFSASLIFGIFEIFMPTRTMKGVFAREKIEGFKLYLSVAEKARINFHDAPQRNPETFQKFLPYALALGVVDAWAKVFDGIALAPPTWYNDPTMTNFNSAIFASRLSNFASISASSLASAPGSASGSGGGGFSGGGGGGGGGGSW
jgi:uncharacterized membrane protein